MCGIAGLFVKDPALEPELGRLMADMLWELSDRGPDSAGFAIYGDSREGFTKITVRGDCAGIGEAMGQPIAVVQRDSHAVLYAPDEALPAVLAWLQARPGLTVIGAGRRMELYKEVGSPASVTDRFGLAGRSGSHGVGHTRMATESAVTTDGAHPFSTGADQCLVHNGSLSNHNSVRRILQRAGLSFATENDSEVAAGYLTWRMGEGASLGEALEASLADLDGFYTFVVGTEDGFAVLRDPISCKPAVMAETDRYVAFGSEYRALAGLPGIEQARVFEPEPARVYAWSRTQ